MRKSLAPSRVSTRSLVAGISKYLHPVEAAALGSTVRVRGLKLVGDGDVEIALVLVIRLVLQDTRDNFLLLNGKDIAQIEDGLLPVGVLGVGTSREGDRLMACTKFDIEPSDHGVDEVAALRRQRKWNLEDQVGRGNGVKVQGDDGARVCDECLHLDGIDKRLGKGNLLHRAVVEPVHVVPDWSRLAFQMQIERARQTSVLTSNLVVFVLAILDSSHVHGGLVGEDLATGNKVTVASVKDGVQHALIEKEIAHPLRDDDIDLRVRKDDLFHLALKKGDLVGQTVGRNDLTGLLND